MVMECSNCDGYGMNGSKCDGKCDGSNGSNGSNLVMVVIVMVVTE